MKLRFHGAAMAALLLATPAAFAVVNIDLGDVDANTWTVNYTFSAAGAGADSMMVLPYDYEMEILRAEPEKGGPPLSYEPANEGKEGAPKFKVKFPEPIEPGGRFRFVLEATMTDAKAYFEDTAKLTFMYQTAHEAYVTLPVGYFPIYTDEPMEVKQEKGRIVLSSDGGKRRPIVIFATKCGE